MEEKNAWFTIGTPQCGLLLAVLCALVALMLLFIGFWRTLFVALLFVVGWFLGASKNKAESIKRIVNRMIPPKNE